MCTARLWPCATTWHYTSTREALKTWASSQNLMFYSYHRQMCNCKHLSTKHWSLGKQIAFICASACFESHDLISNCYCCNSLEDLLKPADSGFLAFIRMPNLPPTTSSEGSWVYNSDTCEEDALEAKTCSIKHRIWAATEMLAGFPEPFKLNGMVKE